MRWDGIVGNITRLFDVSERDRVLDAVPPFGLRYWRALISSFALRHGPSTNDELTHQNSPAKTCSNERGIYVRPLRYAQPWLVITGGATRRGTSNRRTHNAGRLIIVSNFGRLIRGITQI
jgi:hypothetical protein